MHLPMADPRGPGQKIGALILLLVVMAAAEINAMVGPAAPDKASAGKKVLATVSGTLWAGFILTLILYVGLELIF